jgi:hypothetical protein
MRRAVIIRLVGSTNPVHLDGWQMPVLENDNFVGMAYRRDVLKVADSCYRGWMSLKEHERSSIDIHQIMNHRFTVR